MKIQIISVGKASSAEIYKLCQDYEVRLRQHIGQIEWILIPNSNINDEGNAILKRIKGKSILLDETGSKLSSPDFSAKIEYYQNSSVKHLTFIIGGSYGVSEEVKRQSDLIWSLSDLVFPHQLVRLMLTEQLYRAYEILSDSSYHHF
jgi:23S rRNA (pseudouridine1915-N3)-methyltransferase